IQQDLLSNEIHPYFQFTHATTGQRFLNFLIDNIVLNFTLSYATGYAVGYMLGDLFPDFMSGLIGDNNLVALFFVNYIVGILNYLIYYTLCEKLFRGYTLGKLITGTRAIRENGEELTFKNALLRSLTRLVPFEVFSGFGVPWH